MRRRDVLAGAALGLAGLAGCVGGDGRTGRTPTPTERSEPQAPFEHPGTLDDTFVTNGDYPTDEDPADGRPPSFSDPPDAPDVDASSLETIDVNGESVRLAPIDVVVAWYRRGEARFVDARGLDQYRHAHVYGSVLSTAQRNSAGGGIDGWPTDARIVTYCGCPHHLSSIRAAGLQKAGYGDVYALDDGFGEWWGREYPMAGTAFGAEGNPDVAEWTVEGAADPSYAGQYAWASAGRQYEAAPIRDDGRFTLTLAFTDVDAETPVRVTTPAYAVTRPLGDLASGVLADRRANY